MATRVQNRLTARAVEAAKAKGVYPDGNGLYLSVSASGAKSWVFRYRLGTARRDMGFGSTSAVTLAQARHLAAEARALLAKARAGDGPDPLMRRAIQRQADAEARIQQSALRVTFGQLADDHLTAMASFWTPKHLWHWKYSLETLAADLRPRAVADIDTECVLAVLKPLWLKMPVTAARLRGRIAAVLDRAKAKKLRIGENPAAWAGHLALLLPKRQKLARSHHAALPYQQLPEFIAKLRNEKSAKALATEFLIITAVRVSEALGAEWREIDRENRLWVIPPARMKLRREHRVPLSSRALVILDELQQARHGPHLFPSRVGGKTINPVTILRVVTEHAPGVTVHGMRSSFRDWAAEITSFPREVAEQCLAHRIGDEAELSYRRGDMLEKRRKLMEAWAQYCEPRDGKVIPLAKAKR